MGNTLASETSNLVAILAYKMLYLHYNTAHTFSMFAVPVAVDGTPLQATPEASSCLILIDSPITEQFHATQNWSLSLS
jgi:hypothetical protein